MSKQLAQGCYPARSGVQTSGVV